MWEWCMGQHKCMRVEPANTHRHISSARNPRPCISVTHFELHSLHSSFLVLMPMMQLIMVIVMMMMMMMMMTR